MRGIADKLYDLGLEPMSAGCFTYPIKNKYYEHKIIMDVEFKESFQPLLLGELPKGWTFYFETISADHWPLIALGYSEIYVWNGIQSVDERVAEIALQFSAYLSTRNKIALDAMRILIG